MLPLLTTTAQPDEKTLCPEIKVEAERLPDLNIPRAGHELFYVNGEFVVAGGHTNGFVPTPTAEYYKDGTWHQMPMVYTHDVGMSVVLKSGKVLLAGGCEQNIGVGQTFTAELYDPTTHSFNGFGSMDQKRTGATGLELDSGKVVISGNWYHDDGIEVYDGHKHFTYIKDATIGRNTPYILRTAKDDAIIFATSDTRGNTLSQTIVDRLKGDTVHIPLFERWQPMIVSHHRYAESFIGDETRGLYAYLIPVKDSTGQIAIAKVENGEFSLLPTVCPVPMQSQWESIYYSVPIVTDQKAGRGYMIGISGDFRSVPDRANRYYILCIDYALTTDGKSAPLTLYYTDPLPCIADVPLVLDGNGNLLLAGGMLHHSNFTPSAAVFLLHVGQQTEKSAGSGSLWMVAGLILAVLIIAALLTYLFKDKKKHPTVPSATDLPETTVKKSDTEKVLMDRICKLMEEKRLYQNSDLKVTDVAAALGSNRRFISDCINSQRGCTFNQFVNTYRIDHAKRLLRQDPDKKIADVYMEVGFSNEQSFFRTFKAITGLTPKEWKVR